MMQVNAATPPSDLDEPDASDHPIVRDYDARRCHVCQCRHPSFGFGPPITPLGVALWACAAHREAVGVALKGSAPEAATLDSQPSLF